MLDSSISELKELYKQRWSIETHFTCYADKEAKYNTSLNNLTSKNLNNVLKDLYFHNFIYILYPHFNNITNNISNNENYRLNNKLCIEIFAHDILYIVLYKRKFIKPIMDIINILPKTYIHVADRHYERISKRTVSSLFRYS